MHQTSYSMPQAEKKKLGIKSLSSEKAPGQSEITADPLKALQDQVVLVIAASFEKIWEGKAEVTQTYRDANLFSFFNKVKKDQKSNYQKDQLLNRC